MAADLPSGTSAAPFDGMMSPPWLSIDLTTMAGATKVAVCILSALWAALWLSKRVGFGQSGRRRMSAVTRIMFEGGFPHQPPNQRHIVAVASFLKKLPDREAIKTNIKQAVLPFARMRSIPVDTYWKEVEVDLDAHLTYVRAQNAGEVEATVRRAVNSPVDRSRPCWEFIIIQNDCCEESADAESSPMSVSTEASFEEEGSLPQKANGKWMFEKYHVLLLKADHCIGDGISFVEVFSRLLTDIRGNKLASADELIGLKRRDPWRAKRLSRREERAIASFTEKGLIDLIRVMSWVKHRLLGPFLDLLKSFPCMLWTIYGPYDDDSKVSLPLDVRKTRMPYCYDQALAMSGPLSLPFIRKLKNKAKVSVNDVMLAAFSGAFRRYNQEFGGPQYRPTDAPVRTRALMPFAFLRAPEMFLDAQDALRNEWTFVSSNLCTNQPSPLERLEATHQETQSLKSRSQPVINLMATKFFVNISTRIAQTSSYKMFSRHSVIFANVPGPPMKAAFCGSTIEHIHVFFASALPQVEILSYADKMYFNIVADTTFVEQPQTIIQYVIEELKALGDALGISDSHFIEGVPDEEVRPTAVKPSVTAATF